jgi:ectoine hydroxylase-related dioxygenase (phytanoyl-CoA dioxygenase family)
MKKQIHSYIAEKDINKINLKPIVMEPGDVVFFDWKCIHGSNDNSSLTNRRVLYLTYNDISEGKNRDAHYADKKLSNSSRSDKCLI